ncbi:hypothetical protein PV05_05033 [Exophiala xenobiotica]|uniref:Uncharacterized protein n=1 Tax=Exophiala xenobiotica TaxID=348802 RepID=A0A0D2ELN9_9EURO|nr:uncharacterized protein PV05_05033 [Exophiala xenobiotica]KIW56368.1 hypothetical protein PV05_05033 [Exophiala xenobiotica]
MSRAVDDIHAVSVSTSGPMPQRSTRLVEAPSFTEGSQCPPQRPTSPPTPEFVTPVSSPQTSALLGGDMTRLSLGPPATQGSGAFLPARQTTAAQEVEVDAPPQRKKERDPNAEYGGLEHDPKLPSPEYHAGKVDWYPDLFEDQICRTLSPYHKRLIARMKAKWSTDFQCLRAVPDDAALRQNIALLVQEAWDVFKEYVPYWTSDPDWSMPPVLGERLREMQIAEAYRCVLRREYELEREVDFNPLYGPYDHRASPSAPGNCLRGKGPLRSVAQYFVYLDPIEAQLLEKVDQIHMLHKGLLDGQTLRSDKQAIAQAFRAYREAVRLLVRELSAKVEQLNDLVTPTIAFFEHEKGRIFRCFNNFEQLVQLQISRLDPEGKKGVGNLFAVLREGNSMEISYYYDLSKSPKIVKEL